MNECESRSCIVHAIVIPKGSEVLKPNDVINLCRKANIKPPIALHAAWIVGHLTELSGGAGSYSTWLIRALGAVLSLDSGIAQNLQDSQSLLNPVLPAECAVKAGQVLHGV